MKRILALATALALFAALSVSLYAQDCKLPPRRGPVPQAEIERFIDKLLNSPGDGKGSAKEFFDELDKEYNLSEGLIKVNVGGQEIYMEPKEFFSELMAKRFDDSEPQDAWFKGSGEHEEVVIEPDGKVKVIFKEETKKKEGRVNWIIHLFKSNMSSDENQSDPNKGIGSGGLEIKYDPLPVKVHKPEKVADVYEGGRGAIRFKVTDHLERYCLDGYTFKVTVPDASGVEVPAEVTTGSNGTATLVLKGKKEGKYKVKVAIHQADIGEDGGSLDYEEEFEVEVLPAEQWSYNLEVLDQMLQPFDYYYLTGTFKVVQDIDEDDQPIWSIQECSEAVKVPLADHMESGTITFYSSQERGNRTAAENENNVNKGTGTSNGPYPVEGYFMNPYDRTQGVILVFNKEKMMQDTKAAEKQMKATEKRLKKDLRKMVLFTLTGRHQSFDFIGSSDPIFCIMTPLNQGTKSYNWGNETLLNMTGIEMPDMSAAQEGAAPQEPPMPQMSQEEYEKNMQENLTKYFKDGNVVVIPNYYKLVFLNFGNLILTWEVAMVKAEMGMSAKQAADEIMGVQGSITFTREDSRKD